MNKNLRREVGITNCIFYSWTFLVVFVLHYYLGLHLLDCYESFNSEEKQIKELEIQVHKHNNESDLVTERISYIMLQ